VTLFNRGQHNPELFPQTEKLRGDRDGQLEALHGRSWDAVIDTCGYVPRIVGQSAKLLQGAVERYLFVSTISVYADPSQPGIAEDGILAEPESTTEKITGDTYGPLKVACEQVVQRTFVDRALIIRPGLIVGPHDPTDRFTYWPVRLHRGGEVVVPEPKNAPVQIIDVRDLAEWSIQMIEQQVTGVFNATGPERPMRMGEMLERCQKTVGPEAKLRWLAAEQLLEADVEPWMDLPLWLPGEEAAGLLAVDIRRALATGLQFRPLEKTANDTLAWAQTRPADHEWRAGLSLEQERALLAKDQWQ
jgi:2'-hydroxyisoflavone reductase